jgi:hypothetical protein
MMRDHDGSVDAEIAVASVAALSCTMNCARANPAK